MAEIRKYTTLLQLIFEDGIEENTGDPVYLKKSFMRTKTDATPDQLHAVAHAFTGLQELPLYTINRRDSSKIRHH